MTAPQHTPRKLYRSKTKGFVRWKLRPRGALFYMPTTAGDSVGPGRKRLGFCFSFSFPISNSLKPKAGLQTIQAVAKLPHRFWVWKHGSASPATARGRSSSRTAEWSPEPVPRARPPRWLHRAKNPRLAPRHRAGTRRRWPTAAGSGRRARDFETRPIRAALCAIQIRGAAGRWA